MKKCIIFILLPLFLFLYFYPVFSQDNIQGEYLIATSNKNISLDLQEANLIDVLKLLSAQSGLNFVSTDAVTARTLTLYVQNTPLNEAMNIIFKANNLAYDYYPEANIFVVKEMGRPGVELKTKVYRLKYARIASSKLQGSTTPASSTTTSSTTTGSGSTAAVSIREAVQQNLTTFGKVTEETSSNSLIVADVPSQFSVIDEIIKSLDIAAPRVMIEVEILDVSKGTVDKMGVNWPEILAKLDVTGARVTDFPFLGSSGYSSNSANSGGTTLAPEATAGGWENVSWNGAHFGPTILTVLGAELTLNFLRTQSDTKYLARPKLLALSNEPAEIKITTDEAIGIRRSTSTTSSAVDYTIERAETGTSLKVIPQVDMETRDITLMVEVSTKVANDSGFRSSADAFVEGTIKNPEERSTKAMMRLKDGETLLIGGLLKDTVESTTSKIPILGDLPLLGAMFRHKNKNHQERELLVFLTPKIMNENCLIAKDSASRVVLREQGGQLKNESIRMALDKISGAK